tara:strand:+ start:602 stop:1006 length:405 start_codon:yes stop_codon:yes gene_type:complete
MMGGLVGSLDLRMMPSLAVSEETINLAKSLTDIRGVERRVMGVTAMEDILAAAEISAGRKVYIAALSRQSVIDARADHLGFDGFFLFETCDIPGQKGIDILAKACSFESALRLIDIWAVHQKPNPANITLTAAD